MRLPVRCWMRASCFNAVVSWFAMTSLWTCSSPAGEPLQAERVNDRGRTPPAALFEDLKSSDVKKRIAAVKELSEFGALPEVLDAYSHLLRKARLNDESQAAAAQAIHKLGKHAEPIAPFLISQIASGGMTAWPVFSAPRIDAYDI